MGSILAFLLVGIVGLAYVYGIMPQTETTVLSQLAMQIFGDNAAFYCTGNDRDDFGISSRRWILFPMLAASMSKDKYMPRMFTVRGDRLGYSN